MRSFVAGLALAIAVSLGVNAAADPPHAAKSASPARPSTSAEAAASPADDRSAVELVRARAAIEGHRLRLAGSLQPSVRAKLQEAIRQTVQAASNKTATPAEVIDVANRSVGKVFANVSKAAIEALGLIALMEAEKEVRNELNEIQTRQDAVRQAKDCRSALPCLESLGAKGGASKEIAEKAIGDVKNQRDSLSELSESESRRQKLATERASKLTATLTKLLKKISETSETITQNLK